MTRLLTKPGKLEVIFGVCETNNVRLNDPVNNKLTNRKFFSITENSECNEITNWQFEADFWPSLKLFSTKWHHLNTWTDFRSHWDGLSVEMQNVLFCGQICCSLWILTMTVSVGSLWILYYAFRSTVPLPDPHLYHF